VSTLSFIGLGTMGAPMVRNLRAAHHEVHIYDVNPEVVNKVADETGAKPMASPTDFVDVDAVVLMLPSSDIVHTVLGESADPASLVTALPAGTLVVDMSSSRPSSTRVEAERLASAGLRLVDAPVSGGPVRASSGELTIMVGGRDEDVAEIERGLGSRVEGPEQSFVRHRPSGRP
jgi:3-hydroxyisobutyrate dehydrogenase